METKQRKPLEVLFIVIGFSANRTNSLTIPSTEQRIQISIKGGKPEPLRPTLPEYWDKVTSTVLASRAQPLTEQEKQQKASLQEPVSEVSETNTSKGITDAIYEVVRKVADKVGKPIATAAAFGGAGLLVTSCAPATPSAEIRTISPTQSVTPGPTAIPTLTPTLEPTPTPTPEPTPTPRATADPNVKCDPRLLPGTEVVLPVIPESRSVLQVSILEYHRVIPYADSENSIPHLVVEPEEFESQMAMLAKNGWHTITLGDLESYVEHGNIPSPKTFVLTFDDGWFDSYTIVFPILQKYGFVATFFVIPGRMNDKDFLSAAQMKEMSNAGMEIGNHTEDHVSITYGKPDNEVDQAEFEIAQATGKWPKSFAYPMGDINDTAIKTVSDCYPLRDAVIQDNYTNPSDPVDEKWENRFSWPRLRVNRGTSADYLLEELTPYANKDSAVVNAKGRTTIIVFVFVGAPAGKESPGSNDPYSQNVIALDARRKLIEDYGEEFPKAA